MPYANDHLKSTANEAHGFFANVFTREGEAAMQAATVAYPFAYIALGMGIAGEAEDMLLCIVSNPEQAAAHAAIWRS